MEIEQLKHFYTEQFKYCGHIFFSGFNRSRMEYLNIDKNCAKNENEMKKSLENSLRIAYDDPDRDFNEDIDKFIALRNSINFSNDDATLLRQTKM